MKKHIYFKFKSVYLIFFCINSIQIQLLGQALPVQQPLPLTPPPTIEPAAVPLPPPNAPPDPYAGKYAGYESYCRDNDFDETMIFTAEQKKRRLDLLEAKIKKNPTNTLLISAIIKEHLQQKNIKMAEENFLKNKELFSAEDLVVWPAEFDFYKKQPSLGAAKLEKFLIENPKSTKALLSLAKIKKSGLFFSEATDIFLDLQSENKKSDYSLDLCALYVLDSHHSEAEKICLTAIKNHTDNPLPEIYLGISYREQLILTEAQVHFEKSLKIRQTEFGLTCLGELFSIKKNQLKSIENLKMAVEKNKFSYRAQMGLAIAQFEEKQYQQALIHFKQACQLGQKDTLQMRKSHQILETQKSPFAKDYFDEIQKCKAQSLF